jgi:O-methyltransferase involved in polyketide biosynthesis
MSDAPPPAVDASIPTSARIYNYWLGGKDHFPIDRVVGDEIRESLPGIAEMALQQRAFLERVVTFLAAEAGVRQFLDVGTGLPTANNTHQVAQRVAPESRVVYVDNDPLVLAHARALLRSTPEGATDYLDADLRDPDKILDAAEQTLDFARPVAITLLGVVHHVTDDAEAHAVVRRLLAAAPSGSYLVISHTTNTVTGDQMTEAVRQWNEASPQVKIVIRTPQQLASFFDGLELVEPGVVPTTQWRPDPASPMPDPMDEYCAVGRKP